MSRKRRRNKHKSSQSSDTEASATKVQEVAEFLGIDMSDTSDDDFIALKSWLLTKIAEAGLLDDMEAAIDADGYEGLVAFLQQHGLADQGGYRDLRKQ